MNKAEKQEITKKVKESLNHIAALAKDIQEHPKDISEIMGRIKEVNFKEGQESAMKLIPLFRKKVYNHTLKTLDIEMLHSYLRACFDLSAAFNVELDLSEEESKKLNYIANETILNTYMSEDGKPKIQDDSEFDIVLEKSDNIKITDNKVILQQILQQVNGGD